MATAMRTPLSFCRRSLLMNQKRWSSIVPASAEIVDDSEPSSLYPPIKPKYPPGRWGSIEPRYAWICQKKKEQSLAIQDPQERVKALCEKPMKQVKYKVKERRPRTLQYQKYVTKTHLISGLPDIYNSLNSEMLDRLTKQLTPLVCDNIIMETELLDRKAFFARCPNFTQDSLLKQNVVRGILQTLLTQMSQDVPHLLTSQYDEAVNISAFWDRQGFNRRRRRYHPKFERWETVEDHRFSGRTKADFILRSAKPLPEFASRDEAPCVGETVANPGFTPLVHGQRFEIDGTRAIEAGHVWGDPCEFGLASVHLTDWSDSVAEESGEHYAKDARLGQGIGASFLWLVAQAYNQGFNTHIDMTYPLTTQTVLTDGQRWQFLAYQLNSLALWLDDEANNHVNVCWAGDEQQLFAGVEGGKVQDFNPDVLRQLVTFLALSPQDRPYDLRPMLPPTAPNPQIRENFIPEKQEEVIVVEEEKYVV